GCGASTFANMWAYKVEAFNAVPYNAALLTRQGICTTVNSDSSNTIRFMNLEAAKSLRWGNLDQTEALRLVTLNAAIQLQIDNRVGSLDISKDGDVAIWNGHPLNAFSKCVMTLIEGEVYFENPSGEAPPGATALNLEVPKLRSVQKGTDHETDVRGSAGASPSLDNMAGLPPLPTSDYGIYAIVGATVHPVSGPAIERGTVVIMNGRIDAVGAGLAPPPKAGVIDGRGLHVYPGLIDGGGTLGLFEIGSLRATQDSSDIARFEPDLRAYSAYNPHSVHVPIARAAGFTMALVRPVGGTICGQAALLQLDGWTAAEALVSEPVALFMRIPSLPIHLPEKDREKLTKEHKKQMQEIEDYLKRAKLYAQAVERAGENSANLPPADLALDALIPYVRSKDPQRIFFFASDYKHILDTLEFAQKQGLSIGIAGGAEAWKLADNLGEKKIPVLFDSVTSYPSSDFEAFDSVYSSPGILARAGVPLAFASGSAADVYNLPFEAGMAVAHGLPEEQAIYALTLGAAQVFGIENQYGSLDPGKAADVIVTTGSPLQPAAHVEYMFIRGRPIELDNKQREDCLKFARRPAPDLPSGRNDLKGPTSMSGR
ncbi:MAG TPA: amidohydrolase family protein, partial [Phycisphaerae bacterium]